SFRPGAWFGVQVDQHTNQSPDVIATSLIAKIDVRGQALVALHNNREAANQYVNHSRGVQTPKDQLWIEPLVRGVSILRAERRRSATRLSCTPRLNRLSGLL